MRQLSELAFKLCSIPSISYHENEALIFLLNWFKQAGLKYTTFPCDNDGRFNVLVYGEKRDKYTAILCSHVDTVGPFIEPRWEGEILYARGACDAKGIIACMIMALIEEIKNGHQDIALLLTVGEEESSDGAKSCRDYLRDRANYLVIGEPTELKVASAQKGSLVFDLKAYGKASHSALPHLGKSAINILIKYLERLNNINWPANEEYGPTFLNIGEISGGIKRNILADQAMAKCIMRLSTNSKLILDIINREIAGAIELDVLSLSEPFSYAVPAGFVSFIAGFGSDAPYLTGVGKPIMLGPGSLEVAHQANEHISQSDLIAGFNAYRSIAEWARRDGGN